MPYQGQQGGSQETVGGQKDGHGSEYKNFKKERLVTIVRSREKSARGWGAEHKREKVRGEEGHPGDPVECCLPKPEFTLTGPSPSF